MRTIIISGFSEKNRAWALEGAQKLNIPESDIHVWKHWETGNASDFSRENEREAVKKLIDENIVNIIAKSIGTLVASLVLKDIPMKINKMAFCGIPFNDLSPSDKSEYLALAKFNKENIICFQNQSDPHGSYDQVRAFLAESGLNIPLSPTPRSDHEYPFWEEIGRFLKGN
jgi:hypothetical protein